MSVSATSISLSLLQSKLSVCQYTSPLRSHCVSSSQSKHLSYWRLWGTPHPNHIHHLNKNPPLSRADHQSTWKRCQTTLYSTPLLRWY